MLKISVILPIYNPAEGWAENVLSKMTEIRLLAPDVDFEFIAVNDGATNQHYLEEKNIIEASPDIALIGYTPNKGKGEALRTGIRASSGELVIFTDVDFPYSLASVMDVINKLKEGSDVVIGIKDSSYYAHVPPFRRFVSKLLRLFVRTFFRIQTDDFMCGLKGFNQKGKSVFLRTTIDRYLFDLEFVSLLSRRSDIKTITCEVKLNEGIEFRKMNMRMIGTELRDLFRILIGTYKKK